MHSLEVIVAMNKAKNPDEHTVKYANIIISGKMKNGNSKKRKMGTQKG